MNIEIVGKTVPHRNCQRLLELVIALTRGMQVKVDFVADSKRMLSLGILQEPILLVDGKVLFFGLLPPAALMKKYLQELSPPLQEASSTKCDCEG
ncbi:MAG: thioredoxin family protein [Deltaproteobacteria bacterium]|nr:thioredoxin family protein [Deltaproteobacteria bacterium]